MSTSNYSDRNRNTGALWEPEICGSEYGIRRFSHCHSIWGESLVPLLRTSESGCLQGDVDSRHKKSFHQESGCLCQKQLRFPGHVPPASVRLRRWSQFFPPEFREGVIEYSLYGNSIGLCLPAAVIGSIVCYNSPIRFIIFSCENSLTCCIMQVRELYKYL